MNADLSTPTSCIEDRERVHRRLAAIDLPSELLLDTVAGIRRDETEEGVPNALADQAANGRVRPAERAVPVDDVRGQIDKFERVECGGSDERDWIRFGAWSARVVHRAV